MNYPNGQRKSLTIKPKQTSFSRRGMTLEEEINETTDFYRMQGQAVIHKKPTPVQIVNVHYPKRSAAVITEAYFKQASTTDYNGVYKGKYIDFEAKETKNKTSFPLANIHEHQVHHMQQIVKHGGISFIILRFRVYDETYLFDAKDLFVCWQEQFNGGKKSISYEHIKQLGYEIPFHYQKKVDFLSVVDKLYL